jgi:hypothetical protein
MEMCHVTEVLEGTCSLMMMMMMMMMPYYVI